MSWETEYPGREVQKIRRAILARAAGFSQPLSYRVVLNIGAVSLAMPETARCSTGGPKQMWCAAACIWGCSLCVHTEKSSWNLDANGSVGVVGGRTTVLNSRRGASARLHCAHCGAP